MSILVIINEPPAYCFQAAGLSPVFDFSVELRAYLRFHRYLGCALRDGGRRTDAVLFPVRNQNRPSAKFRAKLLGSPHARTKTVDAVPSNLIRSCGALFYAIKVLYYYRATSSVTPPTAISRS